ncbi:DUF1998 domain-containing protein [Mycobacterium sp. E2733]|uniref:DUF1998 domain-containing protein n=1 Tax=Mycobacterium sp. E2733 TaxID=1834138 RepID=UPI000A895EF2|nr:DUF1998 domain-containing protein [Mycobacterium sp. E2733]
MTNDIDAVPSDQPAEDGADAPSVQRSQENLLDRLLYKGVLPRYAFPTDVVGFHVFDRDVSGPYHWEYRYAPSQGLPIALTQYAPGKVVWIDGKEWTSGAIFSPFGEERAQAWRDKWLYFECQVCHYAKHVPYDQAERGDEIDCPACGAEGRFGKAMNWMRPPGFAHPLTKDPGTSPDDAPARSYATRAKLVAEGPANASEWTRLSDGLEQTYRRDTLLVTNTGPRGEGYSYCTLCGLIEPTATATGIVGGTHKKPYPHKDPDCAGNRSTRGLVLGTDFISDVLLVRLTVEPPLTLRPELLPTQVALRTIAEALTIAATDRLEIEATEIQAEFRPALSHRVSEGLEAEIYLYDTLPGGAGFTQRVSTFGISIFEDTLKRLEDCPADCDESCYRCLRSFRNRFEHGLLDRRIGRSLLRYLLYGTPPVLDQVRLEQSANRLYADLYSRSVDDVTFERNGLVRIDGIGDVVAPILATRADQQWIFAVQGPLTQNVAPTQELNDAKEYGSVPVHLIDDMVISRNLPIASRQVLQWLS